MSVGGGGDGVNFNIDDEFNRKMEGSRYLRYHLMKPSLPLLLESFYNSFGFAGSEKEKSGLVLDIQRVFGSVEERGEFKEVFVAAAQLKVWRVVIVCMCMYECLCV